MVGVDRGTRVMRYGGRRVYGTVMRLSSQTGGMAVTVRMAMRFLAVSLSADDGCHGLCTARW